MKKGPDPVLTDLLDEIPHVYYNQAVELAKAGLLAGARDRLLAALALDPGMLDARIVLGKVYAQMGNHPEAISCWEAALKLSPGNDAAQAGIARARRLMAAGRTRRWILGVGTAVVILSMGMLSVRIQRTAWTQPDAPSVLSPAPAPLPAQAEAPAAKTDPAPPPLPLDSVRDALHGCAALRGTLLEVTPLESGIMISGTVDSEEQRHVACVLAESRTGGIPVDASALAVRHPSPLAESFARLLRQVGGRSLAAVQTTQKEGILYLAGTVSCEADKERAETLAGVLVGVKSVDSSRLQVLGAADYVFQAGDSLWNLAVRFCGNGKKWDSIARDNPDLPGDCHRIPVGTLIKITPCSAETRSGATNPGPVGTGG